MATWNIDPAHTQANFTAKHMMITTVRGSFKNVSGTLEFDAANPAAASVNVELDAASIDSGVSDRDNHLRSADFLDVANFPKITFKSTRIVPQGEGKAQIYGDLTIRGVTREVVIDAEHLGTAPHAFNPSNKVAGFSGTTSINREDFGLTWNMALEAGGVLVSKEVKISLDVEAILVGEQQPA